MPQPKQDFVADLREIAHRAQLQHEAAQRPKKERAARLREEKEREEREEQEACADDIMCWLPSKLTAAATEGKTVTTVLLDGHYRTAAHIVVKRLADLGFQVTHNTINKDNLILDRILDIGGRYRVELIISWDRK